jgi:hypothetical protein
LDEHAADNFAATTWTVNLLKKGEDTALVVWHNFGTVADLGGF